LRPKHAAIARKIEISLMIKKRAAELTRSSAAEKLLRRSYWDISKRWKWAKWWSLGFTCAATTGAKKYSSRSCGSDC
jgi:hypothetical protein